MNDRFTERIRLNNDILTRIAAIDEFKGLWHGTARLDPHILKRLRTSVIITSTGASTRIEGSRMDDEQIARLLRGLKTDPPVGRDAEEVAGYADLLGRIFDNYKSFQLSEGFILQFHEILMHFSEKDGAHKGKYKTSDNIVVLRQPNKPDVILFRPTPPYLVQKEMSDIIEWTNERLAKSDTHPLLVIANFIFEFLAIHPFIDGNGRLSRALTNLLLLKNQYAYIPYVSLEEIIEERQDDYYLSLRTTQKNHKTEHEDITAWTTFLLDALLEQTRRARALMDNEHPENTLSLQQTAVYALFNEAEPIGVKGIMLKSGGTIPNATVKQSLSRLLATGLIKRIGKGAGTRYRKISR